MERLPSDHGDHSNGRVRPDEGLEVSDVRRRRRQSPEEFRIHLGMGRPDFRSGEAEQSFVGVHEIPRDSQADKDKQAVGAVHAPGSTVRGAFEGAGNLRHHF